MTYSLPLTCRFKKNSILSICPMNVHATAILSSYNPFSLSPFTNESTYLSIYVVYLLSIFFIGLHISRYFYLYNYLSLQVEEVYDPQREPLVEKNPCYVAIFLCIALFLSLTIYLIYTLMQKAGYYIFGIYFFVHSESC